MPYTNVIDAELGAAIDSLEDAYETVRVIHTSLDCFALLSQINEAIKTAKEKFVNYGLKETKPVEQKTLCTPAPAEEGAPAEEPAPAEVVAPVEKVTPAAPPDDTATIESDAFAECSFNIAGHA